MTRAGLIAEYEQSQKKLAALEVENQHLKAENFLLKEQCKQEHAP